jgi:hypothetical protein
VGKLLTVIYQELSECKPGLLNVQAMAGRNHAAHHITLACDCPITKCEQLI